MEPNNNHDKRTNYFKSKIDDIQLKSKCMLYGHRDDEWLQQTNSNEYKTRHDWVGKVIHCELVRN